LEIPHGVVITRHNELNYRFSIENPQESNPILLQQLSILHAPLMAFQEIPRSLEEVYLKVMADAQATHGEVVHAG
jgi:hypothetical protein